MSTAVSKRGVVKFTRPSFLFLTPEDGSPEVFCHVSVIKSAGLVLSKGDRVAAVVEPSARGLKAISIALID
jgi:CspA family cold shock protein